MRVRIFFPSFVWPDTHRTEPLDKGDECLEECECYLMGTTEDATERVRDLVDAGRDYLCVGPTAADPGQIDVFARDVLSELA